MMPSDSPGHRSVRRVLQAVLMAGMLALAACDSVEDRIADMYTEAGELFEEGAYAKAGVVYRGILRLDGEQLEARLGLARIEERLGRFSTALPHYLYVAERQPDNVEALTKSAQYMLLGQELERALQLSDRAFEVAPNDIEVLATRASVAYRLGNTEAAIETARKALEIDPFHQAANLLLATERVDSGAFDEALSILDALIDVRRNELAVHLMKLRVLEIAGRNEAVAQHLRAMVEIFPQVAEVKQALAQWYVGQGDMDGAEALLRQIAEGAPENTARSLDVAQFLLRTKGVGAAETELLRLVTDAPDPWPYQSALASLYHAEGRKGDARTILDGVIAEQGASTSGNLARVQLARVEIAEGDIARAATLVGEVLANDETNVAALTLRAAIEISEQRYDDAVLTTRKALGESPQAVNLLLLAAKAHELGGNAALASENLGLATRVSNYNPEVALRYVAFLRANDQLQGAESILAETARRAPTNAEVLTLLADIRLRLQDWIGAETVAAQLRQLEGGAETAQRIAAASLSGQERFSESIELLHDLNPSQNAQRSGVVTQLVNTYARAGRMDDANAFVDRVLEQNPRNLEALLLKATLQAAGGDIDAAAATSERAIAEYPTVPGAYMTLARVRLEIGDTDDALAVLGRGIDAGADSAELRLMRANVFERRLDFDSAIAEYEILFEAIPDSLIVANNLASLLAEHRSDDPEAIGRAGTIARRLRGSDVPQMQDTFGWIMHLNGDHVAALRSLKPAAEALPDNPVVQYHIGVVYAALGEVELARQHLERVVQLTDETRFPHMPEVRAALAGLVAQ